MATPHTCPVCCGQGTVSRPPGIAGDQDSWVASGTGPYQCRACNGTCIVWEYTIVWPFTQDPREPGRKE